MTIYTLHFESDADPYDLAGRLFALTSAVPMVANEPMQLHVGTCDQCTHCVYKEEEE